MFFNSTMSSFRSIENKHDVYRGSQCKEKFKRARNENNKFQKRNEVINKKAEGII